MTIPRPLRLLGLLAASCLLGACSTSPWSQSVQIPFTHTVALADGMTEEQVTPDQVHVQNIPWKRMDQALQVFDDALTASDVHATQWTYQEQLDLGSSLRTMLQLSEDMAIAPVGITHFTSTNDLTNPQQIALTAATLGADIAVWSRVDAGETDVIVREPITEYTTGSVKINGKWESYTETSTAWVPVPSRVRQWRYAAMFLRTDPSIGTAAAFEMQ
ncbi:MAG: hypothetical protein H6815_10815 [Phycisphaeraceae bacterium]|nr:hypothetical protein [Phycisphaerales bacterium]MCB9860926.1 hypothetical protein [Phycisphaeraceae bacterium]